MFRNHRSCEPSEIREQSPINRLSSSHTSPLLCLKALTCQNKHVPISNIFIPPIEPKAPDQKGSSTSSPNCIFGSGPLLSRGALSLPFQPCASFLIDPVENEIRKRTPVARCSVCCFCSIALNTDLVCSCPSRGRRGASNLSENWMYEIRQLLLSSTPSSSRRS
jgi:hypothetical protein